MHGDLHKNLGNTQSELARFIGLSSSSLSSYNAGRRSIPTRAKNILFSLWQICHFAYRPQHQSPETEELKMKLEKELLEYKSFLKSRSEALIYELKQEKIKLEDNFDDAENRHFKLNVALKEMGEISEDERTFIFLLRHKDEQEMRANSPKAQYEVQRKIDELSYWLSQLQ